LSLFTFEFDRYLLYDEFTEFVEEAAARYPKLARLQSIGKSHRGRDIWAFELTNLETGDPSTKPAFYVDANCHGEEVAGSMAALYLVRLVLEEYGSDPVVTELMDTRTLYVLPRINPDGAEISMTTPYHTVGNGHYLPWEWKPARGLYPADVDNDGALREMLVARPDGEWKKSRKDDRVLLRREPEDTWEDDGPFYMRLPEGLIAGYDGSTIDIPKPPHGNLNRQYPFNWAPDPIEYGAGVYPLNEPEAKAIAEFILARPNITGAHAYHTHGGVLLRPTFAEHAPMTEEDVRLLDDLALLGQRITDYTPIPLPGTQNEGNDDAVRHGLFSGWVYSQLGIPGYTVEIWDVDPAAGLPKRREFTPRRVVSEEHRIQLLRWNDTELDGEFVKPWTTVEHPQLGEVEIGGWDPLYGKRNPPPRYLKETIEPVARYGVAQAMLTPHVQITRAELSQVGDNMHRLVADFTNVGYLPTNVTRVAVDMGIDSRPVVELTGDGPLRFASGEASTELEHLPGRYERRESWSGWGRPWVRPTVKREWVFSSDGATYVDIVLTSEKGGTDTRRLAL